MTSAQRLDGAFRRGLSLSPKFDPSNADSSSLQQWDSISHLQLVGAIEDEFGVRLSPADVVELTSYSAAIAILRRLGTWRDA